MSRRQHLREDILFESYLASRCGDPLDPPVAEHLTDCSECGLRYAELTQFMDALSEGAITGADAVFTPDRLRAQQQQIARRLEHLGHPARVITFPGQTSSPRSGRTVPRLARRWVAASLAAGLFIGVSTGLFLNWGASRGVPLRRAGTVARQAVQIAPSARTELSRPDVFEADDVFLSELELAGDRPRIRELSAVDALTPHVREITLR
jgi:anti-sigma factor RsiW